MSLKPTKITVFDHKTNKTDSHTTDTSTTTPDTQTEDLYDLLKDAPDNYILRQIFEPATETETQNQHPNTSQPQETQTDHLNTIHIDNSNRRRRHLRINQNSLLCITWKTTPP